MHTLYLALLLGSSMAYFKPVDLAIPTSESGVVYVNETFAANTVEGVSFTLANRSLKSIPLQIPGVMNPNLSPMSNSGVSLKIGQEVFFFEGKKKYLLLAVSPELKDQTLIVNELIKVRLKEIHAESESAKDSMAKTKKAKSQD